MKITVKKVTETEEEVEINLPYFFKHKNQLFAILSEINIIQVRIDYGISQYEKIGVIYPEAYDSVEITAGEFITAFDKQMESLQQALKPNLSQTKNQ